MLTQKSASLKLVYNSRSSDKATSVLLDRFSPVIYLSGEVTPKMAEDFIRAINEIENTRNTDAALIKLDSVGGDLSACFKIVNTMKSSPLNLATFCVGLSYSACSVILSAGAPGMRFAAPLSHHMIHSAATVLGGRVEELRTGLKSTEQMNHMVISELASNCGKSVKFIEDAIKATGSTDLFMTPWEAKKLGLVDHVANVALAKSESYHLQIDSIEDPDNPDTPKKTKSKAKPKPKEAEEPPVLVKEPEPVKESETISKPKRTGKKVSK